MTNNAAAPKKSRKRLPPTTEMGRQLMKMGRERMAEEAAATAERMLTERRQREESEQLLANRSGNVPAVAAVQRGLLNSIVGSLASEDITPIIDVLPLNGDWRLEAWTDFDRIHIRYHLDSDPRIMAAVLRGLMYHEGGHIRWTIPFPELMEMAGIDKTDYTGEQLKRLQRAWNALEDQRMETAVVSDSPRKAAFFTPMVMLELLDTLPKAVANYPLLVWRRYLPKHIRDACRAAFVVTQDEMLTQQIEACVDDYVKATTAQDMWAAVEWFVLLSSQLRSDMSLPQAAEQHRRQQTVRSDPNGDPQPTKGGDPSEKMDIPIDPTMDASPASSSEDEGDDVTEEGQGAGTDGDEEGDEDGNGQGAGEGDDDGWGEGDDEGEGEGEGADSGAEEASDGSSQGDKGHGAGARSDERSDHQPLSQDMLNDAIANAEEERYNDRALDADVNAYHDALERRGSKLTPYPLVPDEDADNQIAAEALADDMVASFNQATMDRVPSWVEGQRTGMLNVGRFMTRQPGDMEYFKQWLDDDLPGYNLAVSIMLDYSGSMSNSVTALAQAGYACKVACDRLDIPCTVTLWDDDAVVLWDGEETADMLPVIIANGNTDPSWALADIDNQRFNKERHLVLIMTDGTWAFEGRSLAPYVADGRMLMGVGYKSDKPEAAQRFADRLRGYGCPDAFPLTDLSELPWLMEEMLLRWS